MKLSSKAKKRLLILSLLISPFVILLIAYLCNIGEPEEYRAFRKRIEVMTKNEEVDQKTKPSVSVSSNATTGTMLATKVELVEPEFKIYSIDQIDVLRGLKWRGPKISYYVVPPVFADEETLKKAICSRIQQTLNFILYRGESTLFGPIEDKEKLRLTLDQFLREYPLNDEVDVKELAQPFSDQIFRGDFGSLLIFAAYREMESGNHENVKRIFKFYTDYIVEALRSGKSFPLFNQSLHGKMNGNLYLTFAWMVLESDILTDKERAAVKQRFIELYNMSTEMQVTPEIKAKRDQMILQYCEHLRVNKDLREENSFNYFLRDSFGGVPNKAFYGVVNPLVSRKIQEFAVALSENDTDKMKSIRKDLVFTQPFMSITSMLDGVEQTILMESKGLLPPKVYEMFPEFKQNYSRKSMAYNYACLVEICGYYHHHGIYPLGEFSPSFTSDEFSLQNKFFVLQFDGVEETMKIHNSVKDKTREALKQIPQRIYIAAGHSNHLLKWGRGNTLFADERFDLIGILLYNQKNWSTQEELDQLRSDPVLKATAYEWTFRFWEESQESLKELLIKKSK